VYSYFELCYNIATLLTQHSSKNGNGKKDERKCKFHQGFSLSTEKLLSIIMAKIIVLSLFFLSKIFSLLQNSMSGLVDVS
jgi:uncharacterized protein YqhQ